MAAQPSYTRELLTFDWSQFEEKLAFRSMIAMGVLLAAGLAVGRPAAGMIAASGAFTAGLGARQKIGKSCVLPMLLVSVCMAGSTCIGMYLGHESLWIVFMAGLWALIYGLLTELRGGTSWIGQQATIVLLVASAYHTTLRQSLTRSSLMLGGGLLQTLIIFCFFAWDAYRRGKSGPHVLAGFEPAQAFDRGRRLKSVFTCIRLQYSHCVYALRQALTIAAATEIYRHSNIPSGYWIPMTALLVLKPDFRQTAVRSIA